VDWIHLAQVRDPWRFLVNTVINFSSSMKAENFLTRWATVYLLYELICSVHRIENWMRCIGDYVGWIMSIKVTVNFSLCLTEHNAMKACWGWRCSSTILDLGTRWRWVVNFMPRPIYPQERAPGTHPIGGCLDAVVKRKSPATASTRTPIKVARSPAIHHWANTAPWIMSVS
jgi:hypothetical protein